MFRMTHANLLRDGEQWMRSTSKSCMLVSTLIAVGAFFANFDGIGGFCGTKGSALVYFESNWILALTISKAITFFSSLTSMIMFLSILTSRYAEMEFLGLLPLTLVVGLITLFISVATMMVAFGARIFVFNPHGPKWTPFLTLTAASIPIVLFMPLQYPLLSKLVIQLVHLVYYYEKL